MQSDSNLEMSQPPKQDLWTLPDITAVKVERARYDPPRKHVGGGGKVVELKEGVEILVETDGEIPIRALSPALYVGKSELAENEQVDARTYRFFVLDEAQLEACAPILLGWVGHPPPRWVQSGFQYQAPG